MLTISLHANVKASAEATILTVDSCYSIYETSTMFFALIH